MTNITKKMSMIRKYHNHKLQTNPWRNEEEPHNSHETPEEDKQSKATSSLFPIKLIAKLKWTIKIKQRTTRHRVITNSHNGSNNKQHVNNNRTTALEWTAALAI